MGGLRLHRCVARFMLGVCETIVHLAPGCILHHQQFHRPRRLPTLLDRARPSRRASSVQSRTPHGRAIVKSARGRAFRPRMSEDS